MTEPDRPAPPEGERLTLAPGLRVSRVITGLWQIADMERDGTPVDPERAARAMERYQAAGLTTFDMADHYGSAEALVGHYAATRGPQAPVEALTKWVPAPGPITRGDAREAVERARRRLRTERLDLLQFHTWSYDDPAWLDALHYLQELKEEGLVGALGLTNVDAAHLHLALADGIDVVSNQVSFSLLDRRALQGLTELCRECGVQLLAYGTVSGGLLTERWLDAPEPDWRDPGISWSLQKYRRFIAQVGGWEAYQQVLRAAARVAERHGASIANVASRAILDTPGVGAVIVGARLGERDHVDDTLRTFGLTLTDDDRRELQAAVNELRPLPGDCGDEYRRPPYLTASGDLSHHLDDLPAPYPVRGGPGGRRIAASGTGWEEIAGYARAVRDGDRILVSGTTAEHGARQVGGDDPAAQATFVLDKIEGTLRSLGAAREDVLRTRVFVTRAEDVEPVARAHGRHFADVRPANTLVIAGLVGEGLRVEIEAEARLAPARDAGDAS